MKKETDTNVYDELGFASKPSYQRHPDRLSVIGKLFGLNTTKVSQSRILELGCGEGGNIIPIALANHRCEIIGIDSSAKQINKGKKIINDLGLDNIKLIQGDIVDLDQSFGFFNYIICHGIFSWVTKSVQDKILEISGNFLSSGGISLISYNCLPGWEVRGAIRELIKGQDRKQTADGPLERVRHARIFLENYQNKQEPRIRYPQKRLEQELRNILLQSDSYLFHEFLSEQDEAFYFSEFLKRAASFKLRYLGDSKFSRIRFIDVLKTPKENSEEQIILTEQEKDFNLPLSFRETLLCKEGEEIKRQIQTIAVREMSFSSPLVPSDFSNETKQFYRPDGSTLTVEEKVFCRAIKIFYEIWPEAIYFSELSRLLGLEKNEDEEKLILFLLNLFKDNLLDIYNSPPQFSLELTTKPEVHPYARIQLKEQNWAINYRHEYLEFNDEQREIIILLDGTRTVVELISELKFEKKEKEIAQLESLLAILKEGAFLTKKEEEN